MFDFQEKRKIRNILYSKFTLGFLVLLIALLSMSVVERFSVEREMAAKREAKERELHDLEFRAAALESKVDHLQERRGVEEELRNRFDVAKDGEEVVVIVGEDGTETDLNALALPPGSENEKPDKSGFWETLIFWN